MKLRYKYTYLLHAVMMFCSLHTIVAEYRPDYTADCTICLDPLQSKSISALGCQHPFHTICIADYKKQKEKENKKVDCPICRAVHQGPLVTITQDTKQDGALEDLDMQRAIAESLESKAREDKNRQEINALNQQALTSVIQVSKNEEEIRKKSEQERLRLLNQRNVDLKNQEALDTQKAQLASHASEKARKEREKAQQANKQSLIEACLNFLFGPK